MKFTIATIVLLIIYFVLKFMLIYQFAKHSEEDDRFNQMMLIALAMILVVGMILS